MSLCESVAQAEKIRESYNTGHSSVITDVNHLIGWTLYHGIRGNEKFNNLYWRLYQTYQALTNNWDEVFLSEDTKVIDSFTSDLFVHHQGTLKTANPDKLSMYHDLLDVICGRTPAGLYVQKIITNLSIAPGPTETKSNDSTSSYDNGEFLTILEDMPKAHFSYDYDFTWWMLQKSSVRGNMLGDHGINNKCSMFYKQLADIFTTLLTCGHVLSKEEKRNLLESINWDNLSKKGPNMEYEVILRLYPLWFTVYVVTMNGEIPDLTICPVMYNSRTKGHTAIKVFDRAMQMLYEVSRAEKRHQYNNVIHGNNAYSHEIKQSQFRLYLIELLSFAVARVDDHANPEAPLSIFSYMITRLTEVIWNLESKDERIAFWNCIEWFCTKIWTPDIRDEYLCKVSSVHINPTAYYLKDSTVFGSTKSTPCSFFMTCNPNFADKYQEVTAEYLPKVKLGYAQVLRKYRDILTGILETWDTKGIENDPVLKNLKDKNVKFIGTTIVNKKSESICRLAFLVARFYVTSTYIQGIPDIYSCILAANMLRLGSESVSIDITGKYLPINNLFCLDKNLYFPGFHSCNTTNYVLQSCVNYGLYFLENYRKVIENTTDSTEMRTAELIFRAEESERRRILRCRENWKIPFLLAIAPILDYEPNSTVNQKEIFTKNKKGVFIYEQIKQLEDIFESRLITFLS